MSMQREHQPTSVSLETVAKQVGSVQAQWEWVEAVVWTKRMLTALEQGVKGDDSLPTVGFTALEKAYEQACQSSTR